MNIVGYINPNGYFPSPLASLATDRSGGFFLCYPNGESVPVDVDFDAKSTQEVLIQDRAKRRFDGTRYPYAFGTDDIVFGTHQEVISQLKNRLRLPDMGDRDRRLVEKFIESTEEAGVQSIDVGLLQRVSLAALKKRFRLQIRFTERTINHKSANTAPRLILQFKKNGTNRTAYRKNLSFDQSTDDLTIPTSMLRPFALSR